MPKCFNYPDTATLTIDSNCRIKVESSNGTVEFFDKIHEYNSQRILLAKNDTATITLIDQRQLSVTISVLATQLEIDMMACIQSQNKPPIKSETTVGTLPVFSIDTTGVPASRVDLYHNSTVVPKSFYTYTAGHPPSFTNIQEAVGTPISIWEIRVF